MRSNIARTCTASSRPAEDPRAAGSPPCSAGMVGTLLQLREEFDDRVELLRRQVPERGHRRGRVDQRAGDPLLLKPRADVRQLGPWPCLLYTSDAADE